MIYEQAGGGCGPDLLTRSGGSRKLTAMKPRGRLVVRALVRRAEEDHPADERQGAEEHVTLQPLPVRLAAPGRGSGSVERLVEVELARSRRRLDDHRVREQPAHAVADQHGLPERRVAPAGVEGLLRFEERLPCASAAAIWNCWWARRRRSMIRRYFSWMRGWPSSSLSIRNFFTSRRRHEAVDHHRPGSSPACRAGSASGWRGPCPASGGAEPDQWHGCGTALPPDHKEKGAPGGACWSDWRIGGKSSGLDPTLGWRTGHRRVPGRIAGVVALVSRSWRPASRKAVSAGPSLLGWNPRLPAASGPALPDGRDQRDADAMLVRLRDGSPPTS